MACFDYKELAKPIISLGIDAIEKAKSGHPGAVMGMSDFITVLFAKYLRFSAKNPHWAERDRFILSNGHASMLLYSILYLTGYKQPTIEDIKNFRQFGSVTAGHPEYGHLDGIEVTTGPLGQGFANAVGMAIAQKKSGYLKSKVYVSVGDGCLMEGISHEAASLAGHLGLNNLITMFDSNQITIDGSTDLADSTDTKKRFESYGWKVIEADGHDYSEIERVFEIAIQELVKPIIIIFNTIIAKHADKKRGNANSHGAPLGDHELFFVKKD
jgi:transketolase